MPEVSIRPSTESDAEIIFSIRSHPLVTPYQYPIGVSDTPERFIEQLNSVNLGAFSGFRSTTILADDNIVGHVAQYECVGDFGIYYQCGFNLHPDFWGQRIMTTSFSMVLEELFANENVVLISCDCFKRNRRCQRLLERLKFQQAPIPFFYQVKAAIFYLRLRWLKRYMMTREMWQKETQENAT